MTPYRLRLHLRAPTLTPWQADTIFGSLCWRLTQREGEQALLTLLDRCRAGDPPLVLSDGFAGDRLPAPMLPPRSRVPDKEGGMRALAEAKRERRHGHLSWAAFATRCRGERSSGVAEGWRFRLAAHNTVSRQVFTTGDDSGELYSLAERVAEDGVLTVYLRVAPDWEDLVRTLWEDLALVGFGRRASVGFGAFQVETWEPWPALDTLAQGANAWTSLSTWVPAAMDPTEGWYRLRQKHGRVGEDLAQRRGAAVFKRALLQIEPGSTFKLRDPLREWYGRLVDGIYDADANVVQGGFALAAGVRLPEEVS